MRAVAVLLMLSGCYAPKIGEGAFLCDPNMRCPSGFTCASDKHCYRQPPQSFTFVGNGTAAALDLRQYASDGDLTLTLATESGQIQLSGAGLPGGTPITLVQAQSAGWKNAAQPNGPNYSLWNFPVVHIPANVKLTIDLDSKSVPVLASTTDLDLQGPIELNLFGGFGGIPGSPGSDRSSGVVGAGGLPGMPGTTAGGGGGGHATNGNSGTGPGGGLGGMQYPTLPPVQFGSGGGGGDGTGAGRGGPGGGAIAIFGHAVTLNNLIDVSGFKGYAASGTAAAGGGGGGSAGTIFISGDSITFGPMHQLAALGASGGGGAMGGGNGGKGADGVISYASPSVTVGGAVRAMPTAISSTTAAQNFP